MRSVPPAQPFTESRREKNVALRRAACHNAGLSCDKTIGHLCYLAEYCRFPAPHKMPDKSGEGLLVVLTGLDQGIIALIDSPALSC